MLILNHLVNPVQLLSTAGCDTTFSETVSSRECARYHTSTPYNAQSPSQTRHAARFHPAASRDTTQTLPAAIDATQAALSKTRATSHARHRQSLRHNLPAPARQHRAPAQVFPDRAPCKTPSPQPDNDAPSPACHTGSRCTSHQALQNLHPTQTSLPSRPSRIPRAGSSPHHRNEHAETAARSLRVSTCLAPVLSTLHFSDPARAPRCTTKIAPTNS